MSQRFCQPSVLLWAALTGLVLPSAGCELVASIDRTLIDNSSSSTGGAGGMGGSGGMAGPGGAGGMAGPGGAGGMAGPGGAGGAGGMAGPGGAGGAGAQGGVGGTGAQGGAGGTGAQGGAGGAGGQGGAGGAGAQGGAGGAGAQGGAGGTGAQGGAGGAGGTGGTGGAGGGMPVDYPTGLSAVINVGDVDLTWTNPDPLSGNTVVKLVRTLNTPPTGPNDATATVVYTGGLETNSHMLSDLLPDTSPIPRTYHYAIYGCTPGMVCETMGSATTLAPTIKQGLIGGGYTIFWRHATATTCGDQTSCGLAPSTSCPDWWKSCDSNCPPGGMATARQIDTAGIMEAQSIGQDFTSIGIPVGRVLSSEFCRCMQTAQNMNFGPMIEPNQDISYYVYDDSDRCIATMNLLSEVPMAYTNTALVSHVAFPAPLPGDPDCTTSLGALAWAEAIIYKPDGSGGTVRIANVFWNGWNALP